MQWGLVGERRGAAVRAERKDAAQAGFFDFRPVLERLETEEGGVAPQRRSTYAPSAATAPVKVGGEGGGQQHTPARYDSFPRRPSVPKPNKPQRPYVLTDAGERVYSWNTPIIKFFPFWVVTPPEGMKLRQTEFLELVTKDCIEYAHILVDLKLKKFHFTLASLSRFVTSVGQLPNLQSLALTRCGITNEKVVAVVSLLPEHVLSLDLSYNPITPEGAAFLFEHFNEFIPCVQSVSLHGTNFDDAPTEHFVKKLCDILVSGALDVTSIDLSFMGIDDESVMHIARALPRVTKLRSLLLEGSALSLTASIRLCESLRMNHSLVVLSLRQCRGVPALLHKAIVTELDRNSVAMTKQGLSLAAMPGDQGKMHSRSHQGFQSAIFENRKKQAEKSPDAPPCLRSVISPCYARERGDTSRAQVDAAETQSTTLTSVASEVTY